MDGGGWTKGHTAAVVGDFGHLQGMGIAIKGEAKASPGALDELDAPGAAAFDVALGGPLLEVGGARLPR